MDQRISLDLAHLEHCYLHSCRAPGVRIDERWAPVLFENDGSVARCRSTYTTRITTRPGGSASRAFSLPLTPAKSFSDGDWLSQIGPFSLAIL